MMDHIEQKILGAVAGIATEVSDGIIRNLQSMAYVDDDLELAIRAQVLQQTMIHCAKQMGGKIDQYFG